MSKPIVTVGSILAEFSPFKDGESLKTAKNYRLIAAGAVTNTALALSILGADVKFVSAISSDSLGEFIINELKSANLDTSYIKIVDHLQTSLSLASADLKGGKDFIFYRTPLLNEITLDNFPQNIRDYIFDFGEGAIREDNIRKTVFLAAKKAKAKDNAQIFYAVNLRESSWKKTKEEIVKIEREAISLSDYLVLNSEELAYITGKNKTNEALNDLHTLGPQVIFVTTGGDSDTLISINGKTSTVPIFKVDVKFDVGAGDTFHAGILAYISKYNPLTMEEWIKCTTFANAVAAYRISTSEDPKCIKSTENILNWMQGQK